MQVEKYKIYKQDSQEYPFKGGFYCKGYDEVENNRVGLMIENFWLRICVPDIQTTFIPKGKGLEFLVSGKTSKRIEKFVDVTLETLQKDFKDNGLNKIQVTDAYKTDTTPFI